MSDLREQLIEAGIADPAFYNLPRHSAGRPPKRLLWLIDQVDNRTDSSCWLWPFFTDHSGYGTIRINNVPLRAHGVALALSGVRQPEELPYCLHSCDNPPCVNPKHLRWGTQADNLGEAAAKGRVQKGEERPQAKITEVDVRLIRSDSRPAAEIGRDYGLAGSTVSRIKSGKRWGHVT